MEHSSFRSEAGFTLIELLTVIAILGILASLSMTSFFLYRADAAFSVVERTTADARTAAEAALSNPDSVPPAVGFVNQRVSGPMANPAAHTFLPAMQIPRNVSFSVSFDPGCTVGGCQSAFVEARHSYGKRFIQWTRAGDGLWMALELAGDGF